jgi:hypothetical protein
VDSGHALIPAPKLSFTQVWADPQPGQDEGTALIGRRIRGAFPKSILEQKDGQSSRATATTRVIEGEIISLLNYKDQWETRRQQLRRREPTGTMVGLLIDKNVLGEIQILRRIDCNEDKTTMNAVELKWHGYEERIQGINKVVVEVCLSDTGTIATKGPVSTEESMVAQWKIKKRITVGTVELIQEMNTANNGEAWFTTNARAELAMDGKSNRWSGIFAAKWGRRLLGGSIVGWATTRWWECTGICYDKTVGLPEQLSIGRRPHHGVNDIYDLDGDAMGPFRKFEQASQEPIKCKSSDIPFIQYKYLQSDNVIKPLFPEVGNEDHSINNICHRFQINQLSNGKQLCDDCSKVIRPYRKMYATALSDVCDCKDCRQKIAVQMDQMLKTNVRMAQDILNGEEIKNAEGDREASAICCVCCLSCTTGVQCGMCPVVMHLPACCRTHQYDPIMRRFSGIPKHQSSSLVYWKPDTRLNHRKEGENEDEIKWWLELM